MMTEFRAEKAAKLVEWACEKDYADDGKESAVVDIVSDLCHLWQSQGLSVPQLFKRVVFIVGTELLDLDIDELKAIELGVCDAVELVKDEAKRIEAAAN